MILRARIILPVSRAPVQDGSVRISGTRIAAVGRWRDLASRNPTESFDLGDVVLMPGLVNAHCHLDYTNMAGQFSPPKVFTDWIKLITSAKAEWGYSDFAESWLNGAGMLVRTGTTTVADIETLPLLLPEVWEATPLRVFSFLELTGVKSRHQPELILQEAADRIETLPVSRCRAGLSPHSPYSTLPELLRLSGEIARRRGWRLCTHIAESALEFEMFARRRGEMFKWLRRSERDMSDCGLGSPVEHVQRHGMLGENLLAVHVNYLAGKDAGLLAKHKTSVVHCPRSHAYFGHRSFPLRALTEAGVNLCLGTDSLASVYKTRKQTVDLNIFEEMRAFAAAHPSLAPKSILRMATVNGALALGMRHQIGELSQGAFADLVALPFTGKIKDVYDALMQHTGDVAASMIDGRWVIAPQI